jgi:hypothetical protein
VDVEFRVSSDEQGVLSTHVLHWLTYICFPYLLQLVLATPDPELHSCVPSSTHNHCLALEHEAVEILHWLGVCSDIRDVPCCWFPPLDVVVRMSNQESWCVWLPDHSKDWPTCVDGRTRLSMNLIVLHIQEVCLYLLTP